MSKRNDAAGLFWNDTPKPKPPPAAKEVRTPPEKTWLRPDYLPGLEEAVNYRHRYMTTQDLIEAQQQRHMLVVDVETYPNYTMACIYNLVNGKVFFWELYHEGGVIYPTDTIEWIMRTCLTVGFNSLFFDLIILAAAVNGATSEQMFAMAQALIVKGERPSDVLKANKLKGLKADHIDMIDVAPLQASLKTYAGRLNAKRMRDLPFPPETYLNHYQVAIVRHYCFNDCLNTGDMVVCLREQIELRYSMSQEYGIDLRSKSDAQIAEQVLESELSRSLGRIRPPHILPGTIYKYEPPPFIQFQTPFMQRVLAQIVAADFVVEEHGSIGLPPDIAALKLVIGEGVYRMGIGGLHSSEKQVTYHSDFEWRIADKDVVSYYPKIILNNGYSPRHLGRKFLHVYRGIVERRIKAKEEKKDVVSQSLKIVINGSFGKLGSKYSILYAPDLLIQVTITGQLSLLMFIELLELNGIQVISANTDGIVMRYHASQTNLLEQLTDYWERITGFETEETRYLSYHARDVNNYIAVKQKYDKSLNDWLREPDGTKTKGAYANPWASTKNPEMKLHKNPTATISVEAVTEYLCNPAVSIGDHIRACKDITKFVCVRTVKGGAVLVGEGFEPEYVGKSVRWYYATGTKRELVYAETGNRVPRSDGAQPCMELPSTLPDDIDYDWYEAEANAILIAIGAKQGE